MFIDLYRNKKLVTETLNNIKEEFFPNMFNKEWIKSVYNTIYINEKLIEVVPSKIEEDPVYSQIKKLYQIYFNEESEIKEESNQINYVQIDRAKERLRTTRRRSTKNITLNNNLKLIRRQSTRFEIPLIPIDDKLIEKAKTENFKYTDFINKILVRKFSKIGAFKNFDALVNSANKMYDIKDQISDYIFILEKDSRLKEIILKKWTSSIQLEIFHLEANLISKISNEIENNIEKYRVVMNDSDFKINVDTSDEVNDEKSFKLFFWKEINFSKNKNSNSKRLIQLLYEENIFPVWLPFVSKVKTYEQFSKSKKCFKLKINFPIIEKRVLNLYSFVNNKMRENKTIQFLCTSMDIYEDFLKTPLFDEISLNPIEENEIRIDLNYASIEIIFDSNGSIILRVLFNLNPKIKFVADGYLEILAKEYAKKFVHELEDILKLSDSNYLKKFGIITELYKDSFSEAYYKLYNKEFEKYVDVQKKQK